MNRALVALFAACLLFLAGVPASASSLLFHDLDVSLDPSAGTLRVEDRITVAARDALTLYLRADLVVEAVLVDEVPVAIDTLARPFTVPLERGERHVVTIRYAGTVTGDRAFIDPRGAFLPAGAGWVPDDRGGAVGFRLRVTTPAPYRAVATGEIVELAEAGPSLFGSEHTLELPSLFAGRFVVREHQHGRTRIMTWFPAVAEPLSQRYLQNAGRYLDRLEARIGEYPHGAFHIVAGPLPVGLGFPGLTYVSERILRLPFMQTRSLAHEIAHCWWGNGVGVDYATGNWSEGLTTYLADYALAMEEGPAPAREMRLGWLRDYAALPAGLDMPVRHFISKTHDAAQVIGYNKVAFVFHMLERELSTPKFNAGLQTFWNEQRGRVAGWADLRSAFENASGRDLGWFFSQWVDRAGAPTVSLAEARTEAADGGHDVHVTLTQGEPGYRVTVPVKVETESGVDWFPVTLDGAAKQARFRVASRPKRLRIDPDQEIFRHLAPGEATPIFRDVTLNPNTRVLTAAGSASSAAQSATRLAARLLRREASAADPAQGGPLLLIGLTGPVADALHAAGLEPPAERIDGAGTARVWAARRADGASAMIVAADDPAALESLLRTLPHYRRYGYLVFEGRRAIERGVWPAVASALDRRLD